MGTATVVTAKDLNATYARLWAEVPGTRPVGLTFDGNTFWHDAVTWRGEMTVPLDPQIAAAICRVVVEDWLHARGLAIVPVLKGPTRLAQWFLANGITVDRTGSAMVGTYTDEPNIHAALVEAAIAVATDRR